MHFSARPGSRAARVLQPVRAKAPHYFPVLRMAQRCANRISPKRIEHSGAPQPLPGSAGVPPAAISVQRLVPSHPPPQTAFPAKRNQHPTRPKSGEGKPAASHNRIQTQPSLPFPMTTQAGETPSLLDVPDWPPVGNPVCHPFARAGVWRQAGTAFHDSPYHAPSRGFHNSEN